MTSSVRSREKDRFKHYHCIDIVWSTAARLLRPEELDTLRPGLSFFNFKIPKWCVPGLPCVDNENSASGGMEKTFR